MSAPILVVVSGVPGSGKTTLAHEIARSVGCPAICRDEIREGMVHAGTPDKTMRRAYDAFFDTLGVLLRAGCTVVAEAAFQDRLWRPILSPLAGLARIRVVRCVVDPAVARARIESRRMAVPTRAAHTDRAQLGITQSWTPISMDVPTLEVETRAGYSPGLDEIVAFASR
ncbi:ATP-binding protein [Actinoplanes sp. NPDC051633]|uniref:AAA family ATPase n=1 Tax=Actinoplanes sp. NPDC051633 TaxID=3155670 RepID=UPI00341CCEAB